MAASRFEEKSPRAISKAEFNRRELRLREELYLAQHACLKDQRSVIVLVSGVEAAGKSEVVNRLGSWLDMRMVRTYSYWQETDEERGRPRNWRFWRDLPARGEMAILFGSWYTGTLLQPVDDMFFDERGALTAAAITDIKSQCLSINQFEGLLVENGVSLIKLWFHVDEKLQQKRIRQKARQGHYINPYEKHHGHYFDQFIEVAKRVLDFTDTDSAPWQVIFSADDRSRDLEAGEILLQYFRREVDRSPLVTPRAPPERVEDQLKKVNLDDKLSSAQYKKQLEELQLRLGDLHWRCWDKKHSVVVLFEGWDAAGKGGAIRRLTAKLDARLYRVIPIGAPTDEELAHHYLWRFWRHIPLDGFMTIYDRSWYGRVLVERVEGLASESQWSAAYEEINGFERQLTDHGITVIKFWLQISADEQLERFEQRQALAYKRHKITPEDWRNRAKWDQYERAVEDMLALTSKKDAPWHLVAAENKKYARVEVLKVVCGAIEAALHG